MMPYDEYMKKVDELLITTFGFGHMDLPDALWGDYHEDGLTPEDAVDIFIEDEMQRS